MVHNSRCEEMGCIWQIATKQYFEDKTQDPAQQINTKQNYQNYFTFKQGEA